MSKPKGYYIFPNILTAGSIFFGFLSITKSMVGEFYPAALFIVVSALLDGFDGKVARLTGTESRFGMEFDSLADIISFGVAPAVFLYLLYFEPFSRVGVAVPFLYLSSGALRLARFNVVSRRMGSSYFLGLPIPAAAMAIVMPTIVSRRLSLSIFASPYFYFPLVLILSFLMVSNIRYYSFKKLGFLRSSPWKATISIVTSLAIFFSEPELFVFFCVFGYVASGPFMILYRKLRVRPKEATDKEGFSRAG